MRTVYVTVCSEDERAAAVCVADRRQRFNRGQTNLPAGETASAAARRTQHIRACLAEIAVSRLLNLAWTGCGKGSDGRRDVGYCLEVRSVEDGSARGLLIRPRDSEGPFVLAAVSVSTGAVRVLGWAWGADVRDRGRVVDGGTDKPCWILDAAALEPVETLVALFRRSGGVLADVCLTKT